MGKVDETPRTEVPGPSTATDRHWVDVHGDALHVNERDDGRLYVCGWSTIDRPGSVWLEREQARELRDYLDAFLGKTDEGTETQADAAEGDDLGDALDAVLADEPLADWERELLLSGPTPTVLEDAQSAVYGDRGQDYGHPRIHWTRTACIWTGLLQHKLAEGEHITPEDVGRLYIGDKLARDVNAPKRDNRVDIAGYALCLDRLETGR